MAGRPDTPEERQARQDAGTGNGDALQEAYDDLNDIEETAGIPPTPRAQARAARGSDARPGRRAPTRDLLADDLDGLTVAESPAPANPYGRRDGAPNALVASAARIALNDRRAIENTRRRRQAWQSEAWDYFDEIGEIGYTDTFLANLMSKLRLYPAVRPDPKEAPMSVDDKKSGVDPSVAKLAIDTLARLKSVEGGQSAILRELSLNLEVAGECYLHGHMEPQDQPDPDEPPGPAVNGYPYVEPTEQTGGPDGPNPNDVEDWQIRSVDELVIVGDQFSLRRGPGVKVLDPIPPNDLVIRIWERHPRFSEMATCAMRRVLAEAEALLLLSREVRATSKSRLSNGILLIPSELSFGPIDQTRDSGDGEAADDPFDAELQEAMITPIQEEGSASAVVPLTLRGPAEYLQHVNHLALDKALDPVLDARIEQRIMRIARGLNLPVEVTTGLMSCLDMASEVLTERGWLSGYDLRVGDVVLTLNHETGQSEWQPVERVSIYPAVDHPMLRMDRKSHSSLSTLNHRWPIIVGQTAGERRWRQSDTLTTNSRLVTAAPSADLPTDAKYSDALVETVAWFYTEGWIDRRGYSDGGLGVITQDARIHPGHVDRIRSALTTLFGPPAETLKHTGPSRWWGDNRQRSWVPTDTPTRRVCYRCGVNDARNRGGKPVCEECSCLPKDYRTPSSPDRPQRQVVAWTEIRDKNRPMARFRLSHAAVAVLEQAAPDRIPTSEFVRSLTAGQLELFLNVSRWADGWTVNSGTQMFSQSDARRVDAYELAVILSGRTPSRWDNYDRANDHIQHFCSVTDRTTVQPFSRSAPADTVTYTGDVWCPTTPNQTWLAKRDGRVYFTGNTTFANAAQVKRSEFEDHIEPRAILVCDAITSGYLQWALEQSGVDQELARTIFVWFDPSAVVASPDPAEQAAAAHKDMLISDQAYRRYLGYSEDDAPSDDEKLLRLVLNAPRMDPSILGQILVESKLFPGLKIPGPPAGVLGDPDPVSASPAPGAPPAPPAPPPPKELPPGTPPEKPAEGTAPKAATGNPPPPVAAAGTPNEWAQLGRNLSALDQMLRVRIIAKLDEAMHTTLERAGNRVRTRIGRDRGALRKVESVAPKDLPAALGRPVVESTGLSETELLEGSFAQAVSDVGRWMDGAHEAALRAVERAGGPIPAAARQQAAQDHTAALAAASDWLTANLRTLAAQRIYNTKPDVAPGENDGTVSIPAGLVRAAMAVAGGTSPRGGSIVGGDGVTAATWQDIAGNTAVTDGGGGPVGGVGTGPTVMGVVHSLGGRTQMYQWEYGQGVRSEFEPHHDLDGQTAPQPSGFQWPSSYDGWPENDTPFPGDHDGCFPAGTVVSGPEAASATLRYWEGEMVEIRSASGQLLAATPNHPVLTAAGWVPIGALNEGDEVLRCADGEGITGLVPNRYQVPARIEKVVASLGTTETVVEVSPSNFHGDGAGSTTAAVRGRSSSGYSGDGTPGHSPSDAHRPAIAGSDGRETSPQTGPARHRFGRPLDPSPTPDSTRPAPMQPRMPGHASEPDVPSAESEFAGSSSSISHAHAPAAPASEPVPSHFALPHAAHESDADALAAAAAPYPVPLPAVLADGASHNTPYTTAVSGTSPAGSRRGNTRGNPTATGRPPEVLDADRLGQCVDRLTGLVSADKIVHVERYPFAGYVYNLDTRVGWYISNSIVVRNCVCDLTPILVGPSGDVTTEEPGEADYSDDGDGGDDADTEPEADTDTDTGDTSGEPGEYTASTLSPDEYADQTGFQRLTGGVTDSDIKTAMAVLGDARTEIRGAAKQISQDTRNWLIANDMDRLGAISRDSQQDWFFEDISSDERQRLLVNGWVTRDSHAATSTASQAPEEIGEKIAHLLGVEGQGEQNVDPMMLWVKQTRLVDAAQALANGRMINPDRFGGLSFNQIIESRYDLDVLFQSKPVAARMVAEANASVKADDAREMLGSPSHGPAPWEMTEAEYLAEIENLEVETASIQPEHQDEWGSTYSPADAALLARVAELLPPGLDDGTQTYDQMYREIIQVAREGGMI